MDGLGIPMFGALLGALLSAICRAIPPLRGFSLAAFWSPFVASCVFLFGMWMVDDRVHEGEAPEQHASEPPAADGAVKALFLAVGASFVVTALVSAKAQKGWR